MDMDVVEKEDRMMLNLHQNHTLGNLIRKAVWETGGEAAYDKGHPLGGESTLIIEADDPVEVLEDAVEQAREWIDELGSEAESL